MAARVLVVEDEPAVQELIRYTLQQAGLDPLPVDCAEDALASLREELPDAVLIDWMLPLSRAAFSCISRANVSTVGGGVKRSRSPKPQ